MQLKEVLRHVEEIARKVFKEPAGPAASAPASPMPKGRRRRLTLQQSDQDQDAAEDLEQPAGPTRLSAQPSLITGGQLRNYQLEAVNWLLSLHDARVCGILADEMGLGKTLETIAFLAALKEFRDIPGPHLVVVPQSTLSNWLREIERFCPSFQVFKLYALKEERGDLLSSFKEADWNICVTTYEMTSKCKSSLRALEWKYIIVDEAHRIKNDQSVLSLVLRTFPSENRLLLTGTPLQNNMKELWALLNFLVPDLFSSSDDFSSFLKAENDEDKEVIVQRLHKILRPFILRRLKTEVEKTLLPKIEMSLYVGLSRMQKEWYRKILYKEVDVINSADGRRSRLLNILMQLRKVCNHPYLFDGAEPGPPFVEGEHLIENSGKMVLLDKLLRKLRANNSRVLIFSQFTTTLDILEDYCSLRDYDFCRIDGGTSSIEREEQMDAFNEPGSSKFLFLLSTRAGGLGINLQTADIVILFDSDFNPQMDLQAQDRAHRIGQKKQVFVYRFVTEGTIEEKIVERAYRKLFLDAIVIQQGLSSKIKDGDKKIESRELLSMIKYGAEDIFRSKDGTITDDDIDAILANGKSKTQKVTDSLKSEVKDVNFANLSFDGNYGSVSTKEFDGESIPKSKLESNVPMFIDLGKRENRAGTYNIDQYYRTVLNISDRSGSKTARVPKFKPSSLADFQLFDRPERLFELELKEYQFKLGTLGFSVDTIKKHSAVSVKDSTVAEDADNTEEVLNDSPDKTFSDLTAAEKEELEQLRSSGFSSWLKKDFLMFVRACEKYGRDSKLVLESVTGKTPNEVKMYSKAFWQKYKDIKGWEKHIGAIERAEKLAKKHEDINNLMVQKLKQFRNPLYDMYFLNYPKSSFSIEEDRFLFVTMAELGYGKWQELQNAVRSSWMFRFDWFIKSKSADDLKRRCDLLLKYVSEELSGKRKRNDEPSGLPPKKRKGRSERSSNPDQAFLQALTSSSTGEDDAETANPTSKDLGSNTEKDSPDNVMDVDKENEVI